MNSGLQKRIEKISNAPRNTAFVAFLVIAVCMVIYQIAKDLLIGKGVQLHSHLITIFFTAFLASVLSYFISKSVAELYGEYKSAEEKSKLYGAAISASMHYLGNAITAFQLIRIEVDESGSVSEDTLAKIEKMLSSTKDSLKDLSLIEDPTPENIHEYIKADLSRRRIG